ncbi:ACP S-malonyltransferase [Tissierella sp.]|uniref:ACP S-malonyltransferase n=1 Tax=Tissierella sp. TaxID=41274 RepID=UPI0030234121
MHKTAFIFPGQGSQFVGMCKDIYEQYPIVKETFHEADEYLGYSISDICFNGPEEELMLTENTQPAILTASIAILRLLQTMNISADYTAGLSLGEYSALVYSGALTFKDALLLVRKRGVYMQEAVPKGKGTMGAVVGLSEDRIKEILAEVSENGVISIANYNTFEQTVLTGEKDAVKKALKLAKEKGAKKAIPLLVSAPFHCNLLDSAGVKLSNDLENIIINEPLIPVISNVDAKIISNKDQIKLTLVKQVINPVLWLQSIQLMLDLGVRKFIEIGPGTALSSFVKSIASTLETEVLSESIGDIKGLEKVIVNINKS